MTAAGGAPARSAPTLVIAATGLVSLINYAFSLLLLWMLTAHSYAVVASVSSLLLVFGTVADASAPWVLAREVAVSACRPRRRVRAIAFAGLVAAAQAACAVLVCAPIVARYADWRTTVSACGAVAVIFFSTASAGYLQGSERFTLLYLLRLGEVAVKVAAGFSLLKLGSGPWGAVAGFALGALLVLFSGLLRMRADLRLIWRNRHATWLRSVFRDRAMWAASTGIIGIQAGTALIAGLDSVVASIMFGGPADLATYQVVQILGRIPFFIAAAFAVIVYPRMARLRESRRGAVNASLRTLIRVGGAAAVIVGSAPLVVLAHVLPARYGDYGPVLPWAAVTGFSLGGINLVTTYWQATGRTRRAGWTLALICAVSAAADVLAASGGNVLRLAAGAAVTSTAGLLVLLFMVGQDWPGALRGLAREAALVAAPGTLLVLVRGNLSAWLVVGVAGLGLPALRCLCLYGLKLAHQERPRILHLAFEDPLRPGSGGGSLRTVEVDSRLVRDYDVTVVCARYPGSKPRDVDGVRYVHVGLPCGYYVSLLSYFACLPWALLRYPSELVIEDFAAPFSSVAVPWLTSRPVIGVVQWLFAREKAVQYRFPFHWVERIGLASHRCLLAVSADLAAQLRQRNPRAAVFLVENGLPEEAFIPRSAERSNLLFLGRLEIAQKGLDLLMRAFAMTAEATKSELLIAGSGPDEAKVRDLAKHLGIADRVVFLGHVPPAERFSLLASAKLVAMPSRYETYGLVAIEALAVGTPVVAFDILCLRTIVSGAGGVLVPAFDVDAYAAALTRTLGDEVLRTRLGRAGQATVGHLKWADVAERQRAVVSGLLMRGGEAA